MEIYASEIPPTIEPGLRQALLGRIDKEKRDRMEKYRFSGDFLRAITAEMLVRVVLCGKLGVRNEDLCFDLGQFGKPFLKGYDDVSFNVSHSGNWAVVAVDSVPVGIDIEKIGLEADLNIAKRYFTNSEYDSILYKKPEERAEFFYSLWTLKESYIKMLGTGLSTPLQSYEILCLNNSFYLFEGEFCTTCHFKQYSVHNAYCMSVCSRTSDFPANFAMMSFQKLVDFFCIW